MAASVKPKSPRRWTQSANLTIKRCAARRWVCAGLPCVRRTKASFRRRENMLRIPFLCAPSFLDYGHIDTSACFSTLT
eukprot:contig_31260_g7628